MRKKLLTLLLGTLVVILVACAAAAQEFIVVDQRERLGEVFTEVTSNVDNSAGTDVMIIDVNARREFRHTIDLRLNQNANLDRSEVEERILAQYDLPDASGEKICSIPADVPAGSVYAYEIEWTQVLREGNVEEGSSPGGNLLGTYNIIVDLQCQVIGVVVVR
jgi:hypothetical protein